MTAIVGIFCRDGIVIGSDSSATFVTGHTPTIEQKCKKIEIIGDQVILAGTGTIGLGQRFKEILSNYWSKNEGGGKTPITIARELAHRAIVDFSSTGVGSGVIGPSGPLRGQYGALLAFPAEGRFHLVEFQVQDFQPELKTADLCFVSMGSGQNITDPFLGLMRRVFWADPKDSPPNLNEGTFIVTWTLNHVIELNPGGIAGPPQIAVFDSAKRKARLLSDAEIQEHLGNAQGAEKYLGAYKNVLQEGGREKIPPAPSSASPSAAR